MKHRRYLIVAVVGVVAGVMLVAFRRPLQREAFAYVMEHKNAPTEDSMDAMVAEAGSPARALVRLWNSGRIPQQHYVMNYLRQHQPVCSAEWGTFRPMAISATCSGDVDLQEPGMAIMLRNDREAGLALANRLLSDADPDTRLTAVRAALQTKDPRLVQPLVPLLDDAERGVSALTFGTLQAMTGQFISESATEPNARKAAVEQWNRWAETRRAESAATLANVAPGSTLKPAPDFALTDLNGKMIRLSDFRGKRVLLNFWATTCGSCVVELSDLERLHQVHANALTIIGISADAVPDNDDGGPAVTADPASQVRKVLKLKGVTYPVAVDYEGKAVGAYDGSGIPLNILIDKNGNMCRRLVGPRSLTAWERILASIPE